MDKKEPLHDQAQGTTDLLNNEIVFKDDNAFAMLTAAKEYTARGFVVHPLSRPDDKGKSPGKKPVITKWQTLTATPLNIDRYISRGFNLGLVCGKASNVTVLDFDNLLFADQVFNGLDVETLRSSRTKGRGHVYFKYNPNLPASKHHDLGIEVLSDGTNAVIPPSVHASGDVYHWDNPDAPIIEMPEALEDNLNELFKTETELKQIIGTCRKCFKSVLKDKKDMHGAEGREYMIAVCTDLKANGATEQHIKMFARLMYGNGYDEARTLQEWENIDPGKTWKCETLKAKLPAFVDLDQCDKCDKNRKAAKNNTNMKQAPTTEEIAEIVLSQYPIITLRDNPKEMYYYEDGVYKYRAEPKITALAQTLLGEYSNIKRIAEIVFHIQNATFIDRLEINKDKFRINVKNGVYNVISKILEPHTPKLISTAQIQADYIPSNTCPEISKYLCEVLRPRDVALILQAIGYCLIPDYTIQKAFLLNGSGLNGKGTLGRLMISFLGEENKSSESLKALNTDKYSSSNLYGKLANIDMDLTNEAVNDDTMFKKLTGGDKIPAERKFQNRFEFYNLARLFFGCNDIPQHRKSGYAWDRRWIIIDFPNRFEGHEENKDLDVKLSTPGELSGLLNLCIEALHWLLETKTFFYDKTPEQVGEEYLLKSNSVMAFMTECTIPADDYVRTTDLYQAYRLWSAAKQINKIEPINKFGGLLKHAGYDQVRPYINGKQVPSYEGFEVDYDVISRVEKVTLLKNNRDAYTHWYTENTDLSRVSRVEPQIITKILYYCKQNNSISNEELEHSLRLIWGGNPTYPTYSQENSNSDHKNLSRVQNGNPTYSKNNKSLDPFEQFMQDNFNHMKNPDTKIEMDYRTMRAVNSIKTRFKFTEEKAVYIWQDYCKVRGWVYA